MNVFNLFESKDIENIKLGLQVVKTLNKQKEFEEYFKRSFVDYSDVFKNLFLIIARSSRLNFILISTDLLDNKMDLRKLSGWSISWIVIYYPQFITLFDLNKLEDIDISSILMNQPQFIDKFDLSKLNEYIIDLLLDRQPQLKPYFNK